MVSDSIANASATMAPSSRDFGKKKRNNRSAKLKQCKLDARREQWLSQVAAKNKGGKETNGPRSSLKEKGNQRDCTFESLDTRRRGEEKNRPMHHEIEMESPSNSPTSILLGSAGSDPNFTGSSSSSSSSGGCCSGNITEDEVDEDDGCLDDWEAVADALAADDKHKNETNCVEVPHGSEPAMQFASPQGPNNGSNPANGSVKNEKQDSSRMTRRMQGSNRAWRPDDEFRPQSLPNLAKQHSFPASDRQFGPGAVPWGCRSLMSVPSSCPICYEDLDMTDTSFMPCACGFRLCLFCHKRILEEDGRCPGCRKTYEKDATMAEASIHGGRLTLRLARSCSMVDRSY